MVLGDRLRNQKMIKGIKSADVREEVITGPIRTDKTSSSVEEEAEVVVTVGTELRMALVEGDYGDDIMFTLFPEDMVQVSRVAEDDWTTDYPSLMGVTSNLYTFMEEEEEERPLRKRSGVYTSGDVPKFSFHDSQSFSGIPSSVLNVIEIVMDELSKDVAFSHITIPVTILYSWETISPSNALGFAGPSFMFLRENTIYASAMMNQLVDRDIFPESPDIKVTLNSAFNGWWVDPGTLPPLGLHHLPSVVKHEIVHGMGAIGLVNINGGYSDVPSGTVFQYDGQVFTGTVDLGQAIIDRDSDQIYSFVRGFDGTVSYKALLDGQYQPSAYVPSFASQGSTLYHISNRNEDGSPTLMNPTLASGTITTTIDPTTRSLLHAIGWNGSSCPSFSYETLCSGSHLVHNISESPCQWDRSGKCVPWFGKKELLEGPCESTEEPIVTNAELQCEPRRSLAVVHMCVWNIRGYIENQYFPLVRWNDVYLTDDIISLYVVHHPEVHSICIHDRESQQIETEERGIIEGVLHVNGINSLFELSSGSNRVGEDYPSIGDVELRDPSLYEWKQSTRVEYDETMHFEEVWAWSLKLSLFMDLGREGLRWCRGTTLVYDSREDIFVKVPLCNVSSLPYSDIVEKVVVDVPWREAFNTTMVPDRQTFDTLTNRKCIARQPLSMVHGGKICQLRGIYM